MIEVKIAGLLAGFSVFIVLYTLKMAKRTNVKLSRFQMIRYDVEDDSEFLQKERELREMQKLYKADPAKKTLLLIAGMAFCGLVGYSLSGRLSFALVGSLAGFVVPVAWEKWQEEGQKRLLEMQFEQAVEQMAMVVKSGGSILAAVEKAALEAKPPLKKILELMAAQLKLNVPASQVFRWALERIPVPELEMMVVVSSLQQAGMAVNMAAALGRIQEGIRERRAFREQVSAITAEGRLAGKVVSVLPFLVIGFIRKAAPQFVEPLFTTAWGIALLILSIAMIFGGSIWMNKIMQIET